MTLAHNSIIDLIAPYATQLFALNFRDTEPTRTDISTRPNVNSATSESRSAGVREEFENPWAQNTLRLKRQ